MTSPVLAVDIFETRSIFDAGFLEIFTLIDPLTPPILASIVETPSFSASMLFAGSISILSLDDLIEKLILEKYLAATSALQ